MPTQEKKKIGNEVKPRINISLIWISHLTRPQLPEVNDTEIISFVNANKNSFPSRNYKTTLEQKLVCK